MSGAILDDSRRVVNLTGGVNFRDLGGYQTQDGRSVRWQTLYRSGSMGHLAEPDHAILSALNIGGARMTVIFNALSIQLNNGMARSRAIFTKLCTSMRPASRQSGTGCWNSASVSV